MKFGVYSAGLKRRDTEHSVIVAGIQSVYKRTCELDAFNLIVVDEAHLIPTEGEGMYRTFLAEAKVVNPEVRVIGLTATPFRLKSGMICAPENILHHLCFEVGVKELIRDDYLCPLVTEAGTQKADTSGLHVRGGEFVAGDDVARAGPDFRSRADRDHLGRAVDAQFRQVEVDRAAGPGTAGHEPVQRLQELHVQATPVRLDMDQLDPPPAVRLRRPKMLHVARQGVLAQHAVADADVLDLSGGVALGRGGQGGQLGPRGRRCITAEERPSCPGCQN